MSANNQGYDDQNDDSQNYDNDNQDQEYDSQDDNSQNNGNEYDDGNNNNDDDNDGNNDDEDDDDDENSDGPKYIRLRGLPWSATHKEILDFLKDVNVVGGVEGIHIATRRFDGVNSGEAYVELKSKQDAIAAMKLDNATMGHRYIEVFNASPREAKEVMRKASSHGNSYVVKLRGLPFSISEQQVEEFFNGLEIKPDREGIVFVMDRRGRATGQAFVQFESQEDTEQALGRNRQKIGHRYIEIFRSSIAELRRFTSGNGRMAPYDIKDRGGNRGGNGSDFGGNNRNNNRWVGNNGGFGIGANNTLGFSNIPSFGNSGNFGNNGGGNFGNFGNNGGGMGNFGKFGNNGVRNFGNNGGNNFGNNSGSGNMGNGGGFNRFSGNSGNFGNDFGDFGNFGNNRNNSMPAGNNSNNGGGFNNFSNFGNCGGNNMGGGGGFGNNMGGMGGGSGGIGAGGNFGPIGGGRNDDYYMIMLRGLPFSSFENDVYKFFEPLRPVNVRIHYNKQNGRHNGTAEAIFENANDAELAMKRHRCKMGARYIELFFNGKAKTGKGGNNYSTGGGPHMGGGGNSIGVGGGMGGGNMFSRRI